MLTITQKRKVLQRIADLEHDIEELKRCRIELAQTGYASASMASGQGSRSYTRIDISKITEAISAMTSELTQYRNMLVSSGGVGSPLWKTILTVYS